MNYYGYKLHEIKGLTHKEFSSLSEAMERNEAKERLLDLEIAIAPKMKPEDRENVRRRYYKLAFPESFNEKNVAKNLGDLTAKIREALGGK
jgi:hypothetical protein